MARGCLRSGARRSRSAAMLRVKENAELAECAEVSQRDAVAHRAVRPYTRLSVIRTFSKTVNGRRVLASAALLLPLGLRACQRNRFPVYPATYHEYAYVSDGADNTVTVLDLVYLRQDRVLQVGRQPTGLAVNPVRNEVYVVNSGSDTISVIDTVENAVAATIAVRRAPFSIDVSPDGKRAYVPNSGSNSVSVLD